MTQFNNGKYCPEGNPEQYLNIVPFQERDVYNKDDKIFKVVFDTYNNKFYDEVIDFNTQNVACKTGPIPGNISYQFVVFDFDRDTTSMNPTLNKSRLDAIFEQWNVTPTLISQTPHGGFHYYVYTDQRIIFENKQKIAKETNLGIDGMKGVDLRGKGGIVYFPPTKFADSEEPYKFIDQEHLTDPVYVDSGIVQQFVNMIFYNNKVSNDDMDYIPDFKRIISTRPNMKQKIPRKAFIDILTGKLKMDNVSDKQVKWKLFYREFHNCGYSIHSILKYFVESGVQESFSYNETSSQLQFFQSKKPDIFNTLCSDESYYRYFPEYDSKFFLKTIWDGVEINEKLYYARWSGIERKNNGKLEPFGFYTGMTRDDYIVYKLEETRLQFNGCAKYIYSVSEQSWYICIDNFWQRCSEETIMDEFCELYLVEFGENINEPEQKNILSIYKGRHRVGHKFGDKMSSPFDTFETNKKFLVLKDGIYDYSTGDFRKGIDPNQMLTLYFGGDMTWEEMKNAEMPITEKFLHDILWDGDEESTQEKKFLLCCFLADCLIPGNLLQWSTILVGPGGNGKGTLINLMAKILHKITTTNAASFIKEFGRESLMNSLLNVITEVDNSLKKGLAELRAITGNDIRTIARKYKLDISTQIYAKIMILANRTPDIATRGDAWWRRAMVFILPNQFTAKNGKEDIHLLEKLEAEIPAFLMYLIKLLPEREKAKRLYFSKYDPHKIYDSYSGQGVTDFMTEVLQRDTGDYGYFSSEVLRNYYIANYFLEHQRAPTINTDPKDFNKEVRSFMLDKTNQYGISRGFKTATKRVPNPTTDKGIEKQLTCYTCVKIAPTFVLNLRNRIAVYYERHNGVLPDELYEALMFIPLEVKGNQTKSGSNKKIRYPFDVWVAMESGEFDDEIENYKYENLTESEKRWLKERRYV